MMESYYVFEKEKFRRNVDGLKNAFDDEKICHKLAYSVKTNPCIDVLTTARKCQMMAEVVSAREYKIALLSGFKTDEIIYNGVIPDTEGKFIAAVNGSIVNIESHTELEAIVKLAENNSREISIGLRINAKIDGLPVSRFGFDVESEEWTKAKRLLENSRYVSVSCIQIHTWKGRDQCSWLEKTLLAAKVARQIRAKYIDLGSNMYGPMDPRLAVQFQGPTVSFKEYAHIVRLALDTVYGKEEKPVIILEPGTPVVADTVTLAAEVLNIRRMRGRTIATLNCSRMDLGFATLTKNVPVDVVHISTGEKYEHVDMYGYTCVEVDKVHSDYEGRLGIGDIVLFRGVGAYANALSNQFIQAPWQLHTIDGNEDLFHYILKNKENGNDCRY